MPSSAILDRLFDIRDNGRRAQEWLADYTRDSFADDVKTFYAVTRCLEIVSEASRRLPSALRDRQPELPRRAIMDVGNVYRHAYDNVSEDAVWRTVQERLPVLLSAIEDEIALAILPAPRSDAGERDALPEIGESRPRPEAPDVAS